VIGHGHVRHAVQVAVVRAGQGRGAGREHDVVGVGIPAQERRTGLTSLARGQRPQPVAPDLHLPTVGDMAELRQPGAVVRCADGHHAAYAIGRARRGRQPGSGREPAHAVTDQQRGPAGEPLGPAHRVVDQRHIVVDGTEHRLQIDRRPGQATALQRTQPG